MPPSEYVTLFGSKKPRPGPWVMGILNVTPDSFSDGGQYFSVENALAHCRSMIKAGVDIIDIGGESSRPGASPISLSEEKQRVLPIIEAIRSEDLRHAISGEAIALSIDTVKPQIVQAAAVFDIQIWNDISALSHDPESVEVAAQLGLPLVLMHRQGSSQDMQKNPHYDDAASQILAYLMQRAEALIEAGVGREKIAIDPGIGFGKSLQHNLDLFQALDRFVQNPLGLPVLIGASRKRMISDLAGGKVAESERLGGSIALHLIAASKGVQMLRVHDVGAMRQALTIWNAVNEKTQNR